MTLTEFQDEMNRLNNWAKHGCGNHGCCISPPRGQGTNSTCKCTPHAFSEQLLWLAAEVAPKAHRYERWTKEGNT